MGHNPGERHTINPRSNVAGNTPDKSSKQTSTLGSLWNDVTGGVQKALKNINIGDPSQSRLFNAGLRKGAEQPKRATKSVAKFANEDWRVRLSIPRGTGKFYWDDTNALLAPLRGTNGVIFPYTPQIILSHTAVYAAQSPTHSNFAQHFYGNSTTDAITITGDFTAQNQDDAAYVIAVNTFFKSATKMFFGRDSDRGTPPPILRLNGYGEHTFDDVPVVITSFTSDLGSDVDYMNAWVKTQSETEILRGNSRPDGQGAKNVAIGTRSRSFTSPTRVPTKSTLTITLQPLYSRDQMKGFSLDDYAAGRLLNSPFNQRGNKGGFI